MEFILSTTEKEAITRIVSASKEGPLDSNGFSQAGITIRLTQTLSPGFMGCLAGFAGYDIKIENSILYNESYYDLGWKRKTKGPISKEDETELIQLVEAYRTDPGPPVNWVPTKTYCQFSLLSYSWKDDAETIPANLMPIFLKMRKMIFLF
jgi:hypothetical protein